MGGLHETEAGPSQTGREARGRSEAVGFLGNIGANVLSPEGGEMRSGRPRRVGPAPWEVYGYTRRTYFRRKKLGLLPKRKK